MVFAETGWPSSTTRATRRRLKAAINAHISYSITYEYDDDEDMMMLMMLLMHICILIPFATLPPE